MTGARRRDEARAELRGHRRRAELRLPLLGARLSTGLLPSRPEVAGLSRASSAERSSWVGREAGVGGDSFSEIEGAGGGRPEGAAGAGSDGT
jgi:hypothetical protein